VQQSGNRQDFLRLTTLDGLLGNLWSIREWAPWVYNSNSGVALLLQSLTALLLKIINLNLLHSEQTQANPRSKPKKQTQKPKKPKEETQGQTLNSYQAGVLDIGDERIVEALDAPKDDKLD